MATRLMSVFTRGWLFLHDEERGQTMTEYALIAALIAAAAIAVLGTLGDTIVGKFQDIIDEL